MNSILLPCNFEADNDSNRDKTAQLETTFTATLKYAKTSTSTNQEKSNSKTLLAWQV